MGREAGREAARNCNQEQASSLPPGRVKEEPPSDSGGSESSGVALPPGALGPLKEELLDEPDSEEEALAGRRCCY